MKVEKERERERHQQQRRRDPASIEELYFPFVFLWKRKSVATNYSSWRGTHADFSERSVTSSQCWG